MSSKENVYTNLNGHNICIFYDSKSDGYKCRIDDIFGTLNYLNIEKAKIGLFNKIEDWKDKGKW